MKRIGMILAIALMAGCGHKGGNSGNTPAKSMSATERPIYELNQDGKIYVFSSDDDMAAFQHGKGQAVVVEKPNFSPKGNTVVFEAEDQTEANQLMTAYQQQHPAGK